ncbi:MAG TPA: hypothetical protein VL049_22975 [Candidatus Dormibacteraeota bacterium]|nr:hypothetical protein [Candidatus Dormibacteraeota bacterium]
MPSIQLAYRGLCTRVQSPEAAELAWLEEFLAPAFVRDDRAPSDCHVVVGDDADRLAALRAGAGHNPSQAVCLVLDGGPVRLPTWEDGDRRVVLHDEARLAYVIAADRRHIEVVSAPANDARRTALMKLVRELAMSAAWSPRSLVLHAAAFVVGRQAILIAGPKRAGKSSLLLHALGAAGARLLANDRVVLALGPRRAIAHGMPTIVNLRPDTVAARFADAAARRAAYRHRFHLTLAETEQRKPVADLTPRPLTCSPAQLGRLLGVDLVGSAAAAVLLLPRVDAAANGIALRRLDDDEAARRLPDALFAATHTPLEISDVFALPEHSQAPSDAELQRLWRDCVARLRVFDCRLGPDAYATDATRALVAPILA